MHLTSHITHSNGYAPYIAYYRSNGHDQRFRKLKPKPKLNPPNAHRSQIKICENRQTQNVQFRLMPNAFRILKPIQKSSKRVWVFRSTGANAFAKNQMRLAYEDKRDLYCRWNFTRVFKNYLKLSNVAFIILFSAHSCSWLYQVAISGFSVCIMVLLLCQGSPQMISTPRVSNTPTIVPALDLPTVWTPSHINDVQSCTVMNILTALVPYFLTCNGIDVNGGL